MAYRDDFSALAPRFTGGLSAISSSIIIYIIFRSEKKLTTIYHRLMLCISIADILGSVAMGLTTLPMPKELTRWEWQGTRLGNVQTCEAQGFFVLFGDHTMFAYNAVLCQYYACAIAFKMREDVIAKRVEPLLHITALAFGLGYAVPPLFMEMYNATIYEAWCTVFRSEELQRGRSFQKEFTIAILANTIVMFSVVLVSFILIIWRVYCTEKLLASVTTVRFGQEILRRSQLIQVEASHRNTKIIIVQALAYIGSFLFSLLFPLLRSQIGFYKGRVMGIFSHKLLEQLALVFMPLQGFFNALIFISHKIYNYRRVNEDVSRFEVLKLLFRGSMDEPVLLSRISRIDILAGDEGADVEVADEDGVEEIHITAGSQIDILAGNEGADLEVEDKDGVAEMYITGNLNLNEGQSEAKSDGGENFVDNNDESGVNLSQNLSLSQQGGNNQPSTGSKSLGGFSLFSFSQNSHGYSQRRSNTQNSNADNNVTSSVGDEALSVDVSGFSN